MRNEQHGSMRNQGKRTLSDAVFIDLANAIILQALLDYGCAYTQFRKSPRNRAAAIAVWKITKFFTSDYFRMLSGANGPALLRKARRSLNQNQKPETIPDILERLHQGKPGWIAQRDARRAERQRLYGDDSDSDETVF